MDIKINNFITPEQIKSLILYSNTDPLVLKYTHDSERFKNSTSYKKWINKKIKIFVLTDNDENLLGIIWIKPKLHPLSKFKHTFAIRLYKTARGKGFSYLFATKVFNKLRLNGLWLSVKSTNTVAQHLYNKLGFKTVFSNNDHIIMDLPL